MFFFVGWAFFGFFQLKLMMKTIEKTKYFINLKEKNQKNNTNLYL